MILGQRSILQYSAQRTSSRSWQQKYKLSSSILVCRIYFRLYIIYHIRFIMHIYFSLGGKKDIVPTYIYIYIYIYIYLFIYIASLSLYIYIYIYISLSLSFHKISQRSTPHYHISTRLPHAADGTWAARGTTPRANHGLERRQTRL